MGIPSSLEHTAKPLKSIQSTKSLSTRKEKLLEMPKETGDTKQSKRVSVDRPNPFSGRRLNRQKVTLKLVCTETKRVKLKVIKRCKTFILGEAKAKGGLYG